ncbi:MAG: shikimate kinase [Bacteroidales bacterium]
MKVFLLGFMGAGKTVAGKKLAKSLGLEFVDLDHRIEEQFKVTINDLFSKYDEEVFRNIERNVLVQVLKLDNVLISLGGGTPCFFDNMELIKQSGLSIYMQLHPKSLFQRLINSRKNRPLVKNMEPEKLESYIMERLKMREEYYLKADVVVRGERFSDKDIAFLIKNRPLNL